MVGHQHNSSAGNTWHHVTNNRCHERCHHATRCLLHITILFIDVDFYTDKWRMTSWHSVYLLFFNRWRNDDRQVRYVIRSTSTWPDHVNASQPDHSNTIKKRELKDRHNYRKVRYLKSRPRCNNHNIVTSRARNRMNHPSSIEWTTPRARLLFTNHIVNQAQLLRENELLMRGTIRITFATLSLPVSITFVTPLPPFVPPLPSPPCCCRRSLP